MSQSQKNYFRAGIKRKIKSEIGQDPDKCVVMFEGRVRGRQTDTKTPRQIGRQTDRQQQATCTFSSAQTGKIIPRARHVENR